MEQTLPPILLEMFDRLTPFIEKMLSFFKEDDKSQKNKKQKNFLDEDYFWKEQADEDVISLLSSSVIEDASSSITVKTTSAKYYALLFLTIFILTNVFPIFINCPVNSQCFRLTTESLSPMQLTLYQVGNICCTMLALIIVWHLYKLQKACSTCFSYTPCLKRYAINFLMGVLGAVLWMTFVFISVKKSQGFNGESLGQITLNLYLITSLACNFTNQIAMRNRIEDTREVNSRRKMLFYLLKNSYYLIMLSAIMLYFTLQIAQHFMMGGPSDSVVISVIMDYSEIIRTLSIIMSQCYTVLYHIDINYIYEDVPQSESKRSTFDLKLGLSSL